MNNSLLEPEVQAFINENLHVDLQQLILKGSPFEQISIQELASQIERKRKAKRKLPTWFNTKEIYYPPKVSIEQTSSEITAKYKADIVAKGDTFLDLTAGFGVDSYYFAQVFKNGIHCELNTSLSQIVTYNYDKLAVKNIKTVAQNGLVYLKDSNELFDLIYIDPSRRNATKGKVFLLEDYEPNVIEHLDFILTKTAQILIKVSPLLDISQVLNSLKNVVEVHCVAVANEMKELLFLVKKDATVSPKIKAVNFTKNEQESFSFSWKKQFDISYAMPRKYLYEPNAAILKSGAFEAVAAHYNMAKLHKHTHLYTSDTLLEFVGRRFEIQTVLKPNKKELKKHLVTNKANVTKRNYPQTVAEIRKKFKIKDGGDSYLFFTTLLDDTKNVLICKRI